MRKRIIAGIFFINFLILYPVINPGVYGQMNEREDLDFSDPEIKPLFTGNYENKLAGFTVNLPYSGEPAILEKVMIIFSKTSDFSDILSVSVNSDSTLKPETRNFLFGSSSPGKRKMIIQGEKELKEGQNNFSIHVRLSENARLTGTLKLEKIRVFLDDGSELNAPDHDFPELRFAKVLRTAGQDNCNTYRIPGLITTKSGILIAVYDARYNGSKDLQEDIDIGMSRSTDGGQGWEPMKVIMDMGEYGGKTRSQNGTGDPCILYDQYTNTIWVAALWMCGSSPDQMLWNASKPGMSPTETGQLMIVKSMDEGKTWSEPYSITGQIKDPSWQLLLQGPGRGITLKDGTLVFPAQFKADIGEKAIDGGQYTCHSTVIWSKDNGTTWHIGTGARSNTTESQVVELSDGSLMLNMRDDRNRKDKSDSNGRAVSVTMDLGKTWEVHPSSNKALQEPNCMASLIAADLNISGKIQKVLFFSNPDNKSSRSDMTIKASLDEGLTWPLVYQVRLNEEEGYGYSCLTIVDGNIIGILYEGVKDLIFQKVPVEDVLKEVK